MPRQPRRKNFNLKSIAREAVRNYGFLITFPPPVIKETRRLHREAVLGNFDHTLRDLRPLLWSSIDNVDSRDLDQLEFCERTANREIRVLVAIADVDHYVKKGSRVDRHASMNATSVYTGVEIFPMLPEKLSTDMSSLNEGQDRLAVVVEFFVKKEGDLRQGEIFRALVRNKAKLDYESIGDWIEENAPLPPKVIEIDGLTEQILLQDEAARRLHTFRMKNGALELDTIEAAPHIENGQVVDLVIRKKNRARYLIENFMIGANRTMVAFFEKHHYPYIQRILRTPDRWLRIVEIAQHYQEHLPYEPDAKALEKFLAKRREADPVHFPDLSLAVVKILGQAEYVMAEPGKKGFGHFGLAVHDYTHSTAPNRRYVDVVIQRLLKAILANETPPYSKSELEDISVWCTDRSIAAKKVERFMVKVVGCVLLSSKIGENFEAIVTGASEKGTYARLVDVPVEGRVMRGEGGLDIGQNIRVRLISLNPKKGFIDFERVKSQKHDQKDKI